MRKSIMLSMVFLCVFAGLSAGIGESGYAGEEERTGGGVEALFYNGRIYTLDRDDKIVEAVAVSGGRISAAGSRRDLERICDTGTMRYDLGGLTVIPGLVDAHAHFSGYATSLAWIDLMGTGSFEEILSMVEAEAGRSEGNRWITGRGWDQNDWAVKEYPGKEELDAVSGSNPVLLVRVCGHAAAVNSKALEMAGIGRDTEDPPGGMIERSPSGEPTGILIDEAVSLVRKIVPSPSVEEKKRLMIKAARNCLAAGLTGVHEMGVRSSTAGIYRELYMEEALPLRLTVYYEGDSADLDSLLDGGMVGGFADDHYAVAGVKFYADGSLGARSAALLEDYSDDPGNRGLLVTGPEDLFERISQCRLKGFPVAVHAIGDRANRMVLDVLERVDSGTGQRGERDRIEHAQILSPEDIPRFARQGVIPSMQFTHCTSDMPWAGERLGEERLTGAYAWRSLISSGCRIPGGSDFPVESIDPLTGIYAAVTRMDASGRPEGGWFPEQCLSTEEAVRAFTIDAAWAAGQEDQRGSLEPGKLADMVILSDDIMNVDPSAILRIKVMGTVLGGEVVYRSDRLRL